jgi:hypothetical protein
MKPVTRIGDVGEGVCRVGHSDVQQGQPKPMITKLITGASTVYINNRNQTVIGSVGTTNCGDHKTIALTGSSTVFIENKAVHRIGDAGEVQGGGTYTALTGSSDVFVG